jgi:hypothetical protein
MGMSERSYKIVQSEDPVDQTHQLLREIANFIALYETIEEKLTAKEIALEEKLIFAEKKLAEQLIYIRNSFAEFQAIMTEAGAARWRIAAENALREGKQHLKVLQDTTSEVTQALKQSSTELEKTTERTVSGISEAAHSFQAAEFTEAANRGCAQVKDATTSGLKQIYNIIKTIHIKNLGLSLAATLFAIAITGLYVNDEWPWEIHSQVAKERSAGITLISAWPHLNPTEQQDIINGSKQKNVG